MRRTLGLPLVLVSLAIGGYIFMSNSKSDGPTSPAITQAESQAEAATAGTNFTAVDQVMQGWFLNYNTYVGATLPPGSGVTLVRADATSYCVQGVVGTAVEHEAGPGGQAQPGPC
ncbi:MAG TPA: hypothetical protein VII51_10065 [Gaiellaceae bacterium]